MRAQECVDSLEGRQSYAQVDSDEDAHETDDSGNEEYLPSGHIHKRHKADNVSQYYNSKREHPSRTLKQPDRLACRIKAPYRGTVKVVGLRVSVKSALQEPISKAAERAIIEEIKNMLDYKVGHYVTWDSIPKFKRRFILRSFMFLKDKHTPDSIFERIKARLVADGSQQGEHLYDIISCAPVTLQVVFLVLNISTYYKCRLIKIDIKGGIR
jgi:hypothetical protein